MFGHAHNPISSRRRTSSLSSMFFSNTSAEPLSSKSSNEGERIVEEEEETVVDDGEKNMLLSIISQLRPGADLSRITLPTFILEPRSMLERITNFMQHPETLLPMSTIDDPIERFISVIKFYMSGWHIKPPGVKKPLNPILGEYFTCYWDFASSGPCKDQAFYIAEQTSHHPPKSSYFYMSPHHHIRIDGTLKPQSRFLGNSAASMMNSSIVILSLLNRGATAGQPGGGEKYILTQPNMYVRGILFGKMKYELGDHSYVRCPELDLIADIDFKVKGFFTGAYNAIEGQIKKESTGEVLFEISGSWNGEMFIKNCLTGKKLLLFDTTNATPTLPHVRRQAEQDERESQKLWRPVVQALKKRDQELATDEKFKVEDRQREEARIREADGIEWRPRFFRRVDPSKGEEEALDWIISAHIDGTTPEEQTEQILAIAPIVEGTRRHSKYDIPPHHRPKVDTGAQQAEKEAESSIGQSHSKSPTNESVSSQPTPCRHDLVAAATPTCGNNKSTDSNNKDDGGGGLVDFSPGGGVDIAMTSELIPTSKGVAPAGRRDGGLEEMKGLKESLPSSSSKGKAAKSAGSVSSRRSSVVG